jgi:hypothetical protein
MILMTVFGLALMGCYAGTSRSDTGPPNYYVAGVEPEHPGMYDYQQNSRIVDGSSGQACILHPDRCAVVYVATVQQTTTISSTGGERAASSDDSGEEQRNAKLLAKHEKAIGSLVGQSRVSARRLCQVILSNPKSIKDAAEREDLVDSCKQVLLKNHTTQNPPAKTGEEN